MSVQETKYGNNSVGVEAHNDPFSSADGMTARRLTNTPGEPSIDRAREAFDRAAGDGERGSHGRRMYRSRSDGKTRSMGGSNPVLMLLCGIGFGAALMYLFDPDRGRGRRARLGDQLTSKVNHLGEAVGSKARDLRNRAQGAMHGVRSILPSGKSAEGSRQNNEGTNEEASRAHTTTGQES